MTRGSPLIHIMFACFNRVFRFRRSFEDDPLVSNNVNIIDQMVLVLAHVQRNHVSRFWLPIFSRSTSVTRVQVASILDGSEFFRTSFADKGTRYPHPWTDAKRMR